MQEDNQYKNDWRIRVGDYQIIYEIDDTSNREVMRVRDRLRILYEKNLEQL